MEIGMRYLIPALALLLPLWTQAADDTGKGLTERVASAVFTATEKALVEEFYGKPVADGEKGESEDGDGKSSKNGKGGKSKKMPHGLAKRDSLPPGLEKQLQKNGTLPPGLAKRDLPSDLARRMPARNDGTETVVVDSDVVLIEAATGVVLDILRGVAGSDR
jgi:hypothetical protein